MNTKPSKTVTDNIPLKEKFAYFLGECGSCGMFYALIITLSSYFYFLYRRDAYLCR